MFQEQIEVILIILYSYLIEKFASIHVFCGVTDK